jgi:hydrogenase large subunit
MQDGKLTPLDQDKISEHVAYSRFRDYEGGRHPFHGETAPLESKSEYGKYSWCKAPRYNKLPAETGPLAEMLIAGHPLISDIYNKKGPSVMLRQLARLIRSANLLPVAGAWLDSIAIRQPFYRNPGEVKEGEGYGMIQAPRGALGHWVRIENAKISHYQIITPTSWNASPRDSNDCPGPWEMALEETPIMNTEDPVEIGHVVRSFDACLVCSVHSLVRSHASGRKTEQHTFTF